MRGKCGSYIRFRVVAFDWNPREKWVGCGRAGVCGAERKVCRGMVPE